VGPGTFAEFTESKGNSENIALTFALFDVRKSENDGPRPSVPSWDIPRTLALLKSWTATTATAD
jgi:hypothetical protein